jgi:2-C-methyl-D-erythritol 4-phosphate cytidylyltransferase
MAVFSVIVLTAAPAGMGAETGGIYVRLDNREVLLRSVELFLNRDEVKQVQVVFMQEAMEEAKRKFAAHLSFTGVKTLTGGPRWGDQIAAAKDKISADATHVVVHDACRCLVPYTDVDALFEAAEKHPAVVLASPVRTPLIEVDEGGVAVAQRKATEFMQLLTPQVFKKDVFMELAASKQELHASRLSIVKGSPLNVRIGGGGDASMGKAFLNLLPKAKAKGPLTPFDEAQW